MTETNGESSYMVIIDGKVIGEVTTPKDNGGLQTHQKEVEENPRRQECKDPCRIQ